MKLCATSRARRSQTVLRRGAFPTRWPSRSKFKAERLAQHLAAPPGKNLEIPRTSAALRMPSTANKQQEPRRVRRPTAGVAIGDGLEEAEQILRFSLINCSRGC